MVDWKKDMKLSDLLARKGDEPEFEATNPSYEQRFAPEGSGEPAQHGEAELEDFELSDAGDEEQKTPFWKREIGFRRQKDENDTEAELELPEDEPEKRSFFKRELGFRRSSDDAPSDEEFDLDAGESESTPFWKRELSFGRRREDDEAFEHVEDGFEHDSAPENVFEMETVESSPFWKRKLSLGRRKDDSVADELEGGELEQPELQAVHESFAEDAVEKTPFWKRELSFGRTRETVDEPESEHQDLHAELEEQQHTPFWKRELSFGRRTGDEAANTADTTLDNEESAHEGHEEPAPEEPEPVLATAPDVEVPPASEAPAFATPEGSGEHEETAPEEPEPVVASSELEPAFEDRSTHDDVELFGDEEVESGDAPFWKREIKFGRRRGDERLQQPTELAPPLDGADTFTDFAEDDTERTPFWKRKLTFGGADDAAANSESDTGDEQEKKSLFGLNLRRQKDPDYEVPESEKKPFFKRELSFRRKDGATHSSAARTGRSARTKQLVGLKIGASQVAAARIVNNGSPELVQLARQSLEQGIVVGGELRDPDALAEALRDFFATHKLPNKNVRLGIGNNRIGVRSFEISGVHDPTQLENAIRFRAQEALPIPLDEAVLDYQVIDETVSPTGIRTYRVLLVVAYRELVDRYVAACRGAGLRLVGIDLEAFALLRALSPPPAEGLPEDTALVAVAIGHDRTTFAVSSGNVCEFTRVLDWGGASLNTAIARALDITPSQAEPVKRTLSLSDGGNDETTQANEHTIRAEEAVRLELQTFARELVSSLHFYQNQPGSLAIGVITLTGGTAHLPGLAAELQRLIGVKVRVGDPLRRVKTAKRVETPAQVGSMAVAIGLGIED
jgi:type IV pilus assembly protein PilM